jgi:hypothetical protein
LTSHPETLIKRAIHSVETELSIAFAGRGARLPFVPDQRWPVAMTARGHRRLFPPRSAGHLNQNRAGLLAGKTIQPLLETIYV